VNDKNLQPISSTFARLAGRMVLMLAGVAILAFAVGSDALLRLQTQRSYQQFAQLCTAGLTPTPDGDLSESASRLVRRTNRVAALATLDDHQNLVAVYPDRPAHRNAVLSALHGVDNGTPMTAEDGAELSLVGAMVPFEHPSMPSVRSVMVILSADSYRGAWFKATAIVAAAVAAIALLRFHSLAGWFERQVSRPLRGMARVAADPDGAPEALLALETGNVLETAQIVTQFHELMRCVNESNSRLKRIERDSDRKSRGREIGLSRQLRKVQDQATTDPLTKLRNRAFLDEQLEPMFHRHKVQSLPFAAVMIDLDNFKTYNDTHGHQVGDALLRFVGALLRGSIRPVDYAVRYGGDEFLLLLPGTGEKEASAVAQRIVKLFGQYASRLGGQNRVSMSAGVAALPDDRAGNGHELVMGADSALYAAKYDGKNTVVSGPVTGPRSGRRAPSEAPENVSAGNPSPRLSAARSAR